MKNNKTQEQKYNELVNQLTNAFKIPRIYIQLIRRNGKKDFMDRLKRLEDSLGDRSKP
jgi:hypothetical protein